MKRLSPPKARHQIFKKNFLDEVVIELRFPTLLSLARREPEEIQAAIRKQFPLYSIAQEMSVDTTASSVSSGRIYRFAHRRTDPWMELSTSHLVLQTKMYKSFEDFIENLEFLLDECLPFIETDFFTRIGFRFINRIGGGKEGVEGLSNWINPALASVVENEVTGSINSFKSELSGFLDDEGSRYTLRYGFPPDKDAFLLDYDYWREDVEADQTIDLLKSFHDVHFDFFWWSLGPAAQEALNNGLASRH